MVVPLGEKQGKTSHWQLSNMPPAGFTGRSLWMWGTREESKEEQVNGNFFICLQQDQIVWYLWRQGTRRKARKQVTGNFLTLPDFCGGETLEEKQGKTSHWQLSHIARFLRWRDTRGKASKQVTGNFLTCLQQDSLADLCECEALGRKARKNKSLATFLHPPSRIHHQIFVAVRH